MGEYQQIPPEQQPWLEQPGQGPPDLEAEGLGNVVEREPMPSISKERYVAWLNDAYSMEQSISKVLENHVKDAKDYPLLQTQLQKHLEKTRDHAEIIKGCIERLGESPSTIKSGMASITGMMQGMSTGMAKDELVKNAISDYATEHFEIASYTALIAAARDYGDADTVLACESIRRDEQEMAQWLEQRLPIIVQETLRSESESGKKGEQSDDKSLLENPVVEAGLAAGAVGLAAMAAKRVMEGRSSEEESTTEKMGSQVRPGMTVNGSDGVSIGHVIQVHPDGGNFLLERPGGDEFSIWVPLTSISNLSGDQIVLGVPSNEIEQQGWEEAEPPGAGP